MRPAPVTRLLDHAESAPAFRAAGMDFTTELCARLLTEEVPLLHFYSLNRTTALLEILGRLAATSEEGTPLPTAVAGHGPAEAGRAAVDAQAVSA